MGELVRMSHTVYSQPVLYSILRASHDIYMAVSHSFYGHKNKGGALFAKPEVLHPPPGAKPPVLQTGLSGQGRKIKATNAL